MTAVKQILYQLEIINIRQLRGDIKYTRPRPHCLRRFRNENTYIKACRFNCCKMSSFLYAFIL